MKRLSASSDSWLISTLIVLGGCDRKYSAGILPLSAMVLVCGCGGGGSTSGSQPPPPPPPQYVLHTFTGGEDGAIPSGLIMDSAGNLYGNTYEGGNLDCPDDKNGCGVIYKADSSGVLATVHAFAGTPSDGAGPRPSLIRDAAGNLFGGTFSGGANGKGILFKLDTTGNEAVLHDFTGGADGYAPDVGVLDAAGNLFGVTGFNNKGQKCSSDCGTVFKLDSSGNLTTLHTFNGADGDTPGFLTADAGGNLYGTTFYGGGNPNCIDPQGCGTIFKLDSSGIFTTLHAFAGAETEGGYPTGVLALDGAGDLYGVTASGGANLGGTVFKLDANSQITTLHSFVTGEFDDGDDPGGADPRGGVLLGATGNLYGTTFGGGTTMWGVVFMLDESGKETVLQTLTEAGGGAPYGPLVSDGANLYGTGNAGGDLNCQPTSGCGILFKLALP